MLAVAGNHVAVAIGNPRENQSLSQPYLLVSDDAGLTFRTVHVPSHGPTMTGDQVVDVDVLLTKEVLDVAVMWTRGDLEWLRSEDAGKTWKQPVLFLAPLKDIDRPWLLPRGDDVVLIYQQFASGTWLATRDGGNVAKASLIVPAGLIGCLCSPGRPTITSAATLLIPYSTNSIGAGTKVVIAVSAGADWSQFTIRDIPKSPGSFGGLGLLSMATAGATNVVVWPGHVEETPTILASVSIDDGATWSPAKPIVPTNVSTLLPLIQPADEADSFVLGYLSKANGSQTWNPSVAQAHLRASAEWNATVEIAKGVTLVEGDLQSNMAVGDFVSAAKTGNGILFAGAMDSAHGNRILLLSTDKSPRTES